MSTKRLIDLSRVISHALRHEPWLYEIELDGEGWVELAMLIEALARSDTRWTSLTEADFHAMISATTKQRHEIADHRIRALYGHSLPGRLSREPAAPPARLFHGTSPAAAARILADGLKPMRRQYVHLSPDNAVAIEVGRRKAQDPVILIVDAAAAAEAGTRFYRGNEQVWLADAVPAGFLKVE
ncbi:MAG TPA: RNA 2'-phosphotransferase [Dongiaceae bacterium]|jgi:putative RNA 2'-phosphotransferase